MTRLIALACGLAAVLATAPAAAAPQPAAEPGPIAHARELCPAPARPGQATCSASVRTDVAGHLGVTPREAPAGYGPADLRAAYQLPEAGAGTTVAVVSPFDVPTAEADLAVYRQQFGLPACTTANGCFAKLDQRGGTSYPEINGAWAGPVAMELDIISGLCPSCTLRLVEADEFFIEDLGASVNTAVGLGATTVLLAGTTYEQPDEATLDQQYFDHPGVAIVAPSGDYGYSNGTGTPYPGVSPYVTSVGGTTLTRDPDTLRGWTETAWSGSGSGCSAYESKPAFQHDPGCVGTTAPDVAAQADPMTGVAAYTTYQSGGWSVMGGTGGAAAIVASIYALAGPVSGQPKAYPYAATSALNDVTSGTTGYCNGSYMCTAGAGYDGPTGLGTPRGLVAFQAPDHHGDVTGTVTDSATGTPLAGASVSADGTTVRTDAQGHYDLPLTVGAHDVVASAFGHDSLTAKGVSVQPQATTSQDFALAPVPSVTLSGSVTDGSGHGWPVYAKVTVRGMPGGVTFTDPATGHYSVQVPQATPETLSITPVYGGYQARTTSVQVGDSDVRADVSLDIDPATCTAPGYAYRYGGMSEPFDGSSAPEGWTVRDNNGSGDVWTFGDPGHRGNHTGGSGGFAIMDGVLAGIEDVKDTSLLSPAADLSGITAPTLGFSTDLFDLGGSATADVDISLDGGTTWQTVWHQTQNLRGPKVVSVDIPQAAGQHDVRARFHYSGQWDDWWQVDDVWIGARTCAAQPGGLVVGTVTDRNTGDALNGAGISGPGSAETVATPDDPALGDGLYWMFSPTGTQSVTAASGRFYQRQTSTVDVTANYTARADFALAAGRLSISTSGLQSTQVLGSTKTRKVTITNTGTASATVDLTEQAGGVTPLAAVKSAPVTRIAGTYSPLRTGGIATTAAPADPHDAAPWQPIPSYPMPIADNSAASGDGVIYSVGGRTGPDSVMANGYAYTPSTQSWKPIADMPHARQKPAVAYIDGQLIVTGGWNLTGATIPQTDVYDPATNTWTAGRNVPQAYAGSGFGVVGGKMYVVGGCADECGTTDVFAYDPSTDQWSAVAPYPKPVAWESCGGIGGKLYCAGGLAEISTSTSTYVYDPATDHWTQLANLPIDLWASTYAAAGGQLVVSGGITQGGRVLTNQTFGYDPGSDAWTKLPASSLATYRGAGACGFYKIGGLDHVVPTATSEQLPGMDGCGATGDLSWVSENPARDVLRAGTSVTVTVIFDASTVALTQPGTLTGTLRVDEDTPYRVPDLSLSMTATPPRTWGKIAGVVTGASCDGPPTPLAGAVVEVITFAGEVGLITDSTGHYGYWLDRRNNPLTVVAALDGWQPQARTARIRAGNTTVQNFTLKPDRACP